MFSLLFVSRVLCLELRWVFLPVFNQTTIIEHTSRRCRLGTSVLFLDNTKTQIYIQKSGSFNIYYGSMQFILLMPSNCYCQIKDSFCVYMSALFEFLTCICVYTFYVLFWVYVFLFFIIYFLRCLKRPNLF